MRITAKMSTAAESGFMAIPCLPRPAEYYTNEDGSLNEPLLRQTLAGCSCIQMSSDDEGAVLAFALEFLDRTRKSFDRMIAKKRGFERTNASTPKKSAERRFDKGKFAYARVDIRFSSTGFRVTVSAQNPRAVVGGTELFAKIIAQTFADNLIAIADEMTDVKDPPVTLIDGPGCEGVFAEARTRVEMIP